MVINVDAVGLNLTEVKASPLKMNKLLTVIVWESSSKGLK